MASAHPVGQAFSPLDEELSLGAGSLTPKQQEHLAHLGSWMPFERAAQMLECVLGVHVSEPTVRRGTERAGAQYEKRQTAQRQNPECQDVGTTPHERLVLSTDGAYVPLVGGEWGEVRTLVIGEVPSLATGTAQEVHTCRLSSFSRMTSAEQFADGAEGEMQRRRVTQAKAVCAVTDGAPWIQRFIDLHRADAIRILDFPHAVEHLALLVEALKQGHVPLPDNVVERCAHLLKQRGPGLLLRWCEQLPPAVKEKEEVRKQLEYFRKRVLLMRYPHFQAHGWPIGSGMVESANKLVVQGRLKGAGMHWATEHVNPLLALRTAVCNDRWIEAMHAIHQQDCLDRQHRRRQRATTRWQTTLSSFFLLSLRFSRPTPPPPSLSNAPERREQPAATMPGSSRPSAFHPWKRQPACRPKIVAKQ